MSALKESKEKAQRFAKGVLEIASSILARTFCFNQNILKTLNHPFMEVEVKDSLID